MYDLNSLDELAQTKPEVLAEKKIVELGSPFLNDIETGHIINHHHIPFSNEIGDYFLQMNRRLHEKIPKTAYVIILNAVAKIESLDKEERTHSKFKQNTIRKIDGKTEEKVFLPVIKTYVRDISTFMEPVIDKTRDDKIDCAFAIYAIADTADNAAGEIHLSPTNNAECALLYTNQFSEKLISLKLPEKRALMEIMKHIHKLQDPTHSSKLSMYAHAMVVGPNAYLKSAQKEAHGSTIDRSEYPRIAELLEGKSQ